MCNQKVFPDDLPIEPTHLSQLPATTQDLPRSQSMPSVLTETNIELSTVPTRRAKSRSKTRRPIKETDIRRIRAAVTKRHEKRQEQHVPITENISLSGTTVYSERPTSPPRQIRTAGKITKERPSRLMPNLSNAPQTQHHVSDLVVGSGTSTMRQKPPLQTRIKSKPSSDRSRGTTTFKPQLELDSLLQVRKTSNTPPASVTRRVGNRTVSSAPSSSLQRLD